MSSRPEIPSRPASDPRAELSRQLAHALRGPSYDVFAVCQLGNAARMLDMREEANRAYSLAINILLDYIKRGDAESALVTEVVVFQSFVKAIENEEHYERCFAHWREAMAELGRKFRVPVSTPVAAPDNRIGFVFHSGSLLGHTEVLFRLLETRAASVDARIYVMSGMQPDFAERAQRLGVSAEAYPDTAGEGGKPPGLLPRIQWLRDRMAREGVGKAVWVSYPGNAIFAFAMGIAPVQVMWTLRYHPVRIPEIDGYITYGSWGENERVFHGQRWTVCPVPLALDPRPPSPEKVRELRGQFPEKVLLGTLAREEKIDSRPFLESVAAILQRNPQCGYIWTGMRPHPGIAAFFNQRGVGNRCHFVGWVDTPLYAAILDVFLETFPLGCGITGYQAMGAGVPLVSYLDSNTVFGMQYWSELLRKAGSVENVSRELLDAHPVLCARNPAEYVDTVTRVITDEAFRNEWKAREARFYDEEIRGIARYSKRFFGALEAIRTQAAQR